MGGSLDSNGLSVSGSEGVGVCVNKSLKFNASAFPRIDFTFLTGRGDSPLFVLRLGMATLTPSMLPAETLLK